MNNNNIKKYIIVTPSYSKSAGVRALYKLADKLMQKGFDVFLYSHLPYLDKYNYIYKITEDIKQNYVVIYPETIRGNPLRIQNVARFVLYYPGKLGGEYSFHPSEKIFTWHKLYYQDTPVLNYSLIDKSLFYNDNRTKKHNSYFIYKGGMGPEIPEIKDATRIDMNYPKNREDLAELLRNTDTLYSYDSHSMILDEALLCGAKVKIVQNDKIVDYLPVIVNTSEQEENAINNFIKITQAMDYNDALQRPSRSILARILCGIRLFFAIILKNNKKRYKYSLRY